MLVVVYLPGVVRGGLLDDLGATFGMDTGLLGAVLGMVVVVLLVAFVAILKAGDTALVFTGVMGSAVAVLLGFWPTWIIVLLAVVGAAMVAHVITGGGGGGGGPE